MSEPNKICPWELTPCEQSLATELVKVKVELEVAKRSIAALREIYRWQKFDEEPADGELVIARIVLYDGVAPRFMVLKYHAELKAFIAPDGTGYSVTYWRTLDLPEKVLCECGEDGEK